MKNFLILFIFLSSNHQCNQSGDLKLLKATSQEWSGGAAAMRGTYYNIYLKKIASNDYRFDSLWVNGHRIEVVIDVHTKSSDTLLLIANDRQGIRIPGTDVDPSKSDEAKFPIESSAAGLLGYFIKGKREFLAIPAWQKLKPLAYP